jgi:hypothetical protein
LTSVAILYSLHNAAEAQSAAGNMRPSQQQMKVNAAVTDAPLQLTPEQRIVKLEQELASVTARLAAMERHTHEVSVTEVGLLSEPINGRRIVLAINPREGNRRTGPPLR